MLWEVFCCCFKKEMWEKKYPLCINVQCRRTCIRAWNDFCDQNQTEMPEVEFWDFNWNVFLTSEAIHCWHYSFAGLVSCGSLLMEWHPSTTGHMHCLFMILVRVHLSVTHIWKGEHKWRLGELSSLPQLFISCLLLGEQKVNLYHFWNFVHWK